MPRRGENIRKRKDGRWEGRYIKTYDNNGKAKYTSVYGKSYAEVKQKLTVIINKKLLNIDMIENPKITYKKILYLWLETNKLNLKESTYIKYYHLINNHIIPVIQDTEISKINYNYINKIISDKIYNGKLNNQGSLSPSYVRSICFILKSSINFAASNHYCLPMTGKIIIPNKSQKKLEIYTMSEQIQIESICKDDYSHMKLGIIISLFAGLRIGEVCGLKWSDIDFDERTIHVQRTIERISLTETVNGHKTKLVVMDTKTINSNRIIPISNQLLTYLLFHRNNDDEYILKGNKYGYIDPRSLQYYYSNILKKNNIRYLNFHSLRHTFATRCIESGMDVKSLSEILGHSDVKITLNTYVHSSLDHKRKQMDNLSNFYGQYMSHQT